MTARIDRLWPDPAGELSDEDILAMHAFEDGTASLRMNFIASIDGAATRDGRSGGLGDEADRRVFGLLRRLCDVVVVGAGTVRTEGYDAMRLDADSAAWRERHGLAPHPVFAILSRRLDLDPASDVFAGALVRPIVYTVPDAPPARLTELEAVADVVVGADPRAVRADLAARGLERIHSEGGPSLFGSFLASGTVDELFLTLAPTLDAGGARRVARSEAAAPTGMRLVSVLKSGEELLLRYRAVRPARAQA